MQLFSQTYRDSGLEGLVPLGMIQGCLFYENRGDMKAVQAELERVCPEAEFAFNVKLDYHLMRHPSNPKAYGCYITADVYKTVDVESHVRCGLVELVREII